MHLIKYYDRWRSYDMSNEGYASVFNETGDVLVKVRGIFEEVVAQN